MQYQVTPPPGADTNERAGLLADLHAGLATLRAVRQAEADASAAAEAAVRRARWDGKREPNVVLAQAVSLLALILAVTIYGGIVLGAIGLGLGVRCYRHRSDIGVNPKPARDAIIISSIATVSSIVVFCFFWFDGAFT